METKQSIFKKPWFQSASIMVVIFGALFAFMYWQSTHNVVSIENSVLDAPIANIAPSAPGILNAMYVKEGDHAAANMPVAVVGSETLFTKEDGIVLGAPNVLGSYFSPGQKVMSIIANGRMRVRGTIEENKGLDQIEVGQQATFTVDTFGSKEYEGIVDEISPASRAGDVVFSISDKRPVNKFDVFVRFDVSKYPELKTGMSARIKIYTK